MMRELFHYAYFMDFENSVRALAVIAAHEDWCFTSENKNYSILKAFVEHTFRRIKHENKIAESSCRKFFAFDTGLFTENSEEIYAVFTLHKNPPDANLNQRFFKAFMKRSDVDFIQKFAETPRRANYFSDLSAFIFDHTRPVEVNYDHIIDENIGRLPQQFHGNKVVLSNMLSGAIEKSKKLATVDYKIAVPQYHNHRIQLLLPLFILGGNNPDVALVLDPIQESYRASTILTLRMAYNNARLIVKPNSYWLSPTKVC